MSFDELQSVGSYDDRSRQSSLASLADDLTKRSTFSHRLGIGLDRALGHLPGKTGDDDAPTASGAMATTAENASQFLSTAAATASGAASGFGSFKVPIQREEDARGRRLDSLAEAPGDAEEDAVGQPEAQAALTMSPPDAPILQARVHIPNSVSATDMDRSQWLKRQSQARRQKRRSSGSGKRPSSTSSSSRARSANAFDNSPHSSRESSLAGDDSDASSIASTSSRLSIASTPEVSLHHRHALQQRYKSKSSGGERAASVTGGGAVSRHLSASSLPGGNARPRGSLSRTSSSSSLSSVISVSASLLRWCSVCEAEFTRFRRPHRCRRCLEAVCAPCSPARLPVPGSGSPELKRACKLCAGDNTERPQIDVVASPLRAAAAAAGTPSSSASATPVSRGAQRRSASMSSIARAPFGVLSKAAFAVAAGFYPAAPAQAADASAEGDEDGRGVSSGGGDAGLGESNGRTSTDGDDDDDDGDVFYLPQGVPGGDSMKAGPPSAHDGAEGSEGEDFGTPPDADTGIALGGVNERAAVPVAALVAALEKEVGQTVAAGTGAVAASTSKAVAGDTRVLPDTGDVLSPAPDADTPPTDSSMPEIGVVPASPDVPDSPSAESHKSKRGGLFGFLRPVLGRRTSSDFESRSADASASSAERPSDAAAAAAAVAGDAPALSPPSASVSVQPPSCSPSLNARSVGSSPGPRDTGEADPHTPLPAGGRGLSADDAGADAGKVMGDVANAAATVAKTSTTTTPDSARRKRGLFGVLFARPITAARGDETQSPAPEPAVPSAPDAISVPAASNHAPSAGGGLSAPGGDAGSPSPPAIADTVATDGLVGGEEGPLALAGAAAAAAAEAAAAAVTAAVTTTEKETDQPGAVVDPNAVGGSLSETPGDAPVPEDPHSTGDTRSEAPDVERVEGGDNSLTAGHAAAAGGGGELAGVGDARGGIGPSIGAPLGGVDGSLPSVPSVDEAPPAADTDHPAEDAGAKMSDTPAAAAKVPGTLLPGRGEKLQTFLLDDGPSAEVSPRKAEVESPDPAKLEASKPGSPVLSVEGLLSYVPAGVSPVDMPVDSPPTGSALEPVADGKSPRGPPPAESGIETSGAPSGSVAVRPAEEATPSGGRPRSPTPAPHAPDQTFSGGSSAAPPTVDEAPRLASFCEGVDGAIASSQPRPEAHDDAAGLATAGVGEAPGAVGADVGAVSDDGGPSKEWGSPPPFANPARRTAGVVAEEARGAEEEFAARPPPPAAVQLPGPAEGAAEVAAAEVERADAAPQSETAGHPVLAAEAEEVAFESAPAEVVPVGPDVEIVSPAAPAEIGADANQRSVVVDTRDAFSAATAAATVAAAAAAGGVEDEEKDVPETAVATVTKVSVDPPVGRSGVRMPVSTFDMGVLYDEGSDVEAVQMWGPPNESVAEPIVSPVGVVLVTAAAVFEAEAVEGQRRPGDEKPVDSPALVPAVEVGADVPELAAAETATAGAAAVTSKEAAAAAVAAEPSVGVQMEDESLARMAGPASGGILGASTSDSDDDGGVLLAAPAVDVDEPLHSVAAAAAVAAEEAVVLDDTGAQLQAGGVDDVRAVPAGVFLEEDLLLPAAGVDDGDDRAMSAAAATPTLVVAKEAGSGSAADLLLPAASDDDEEEEKRVGRNAVIETNDKESNVELGDGAQFEGVGAAAAAGAYTKISAESPEMSSSTAVPPSNEKLATSGDDHSKVPSSYGTIWDSSEVRHDEECAMAAAAAAAGLAAAASSGVELTGNIPTEEKTPPPAARTASVASPMEIGGGTGAPPSTPTAWGSVGWAPAKIGTSGGVEKEARAPSIGAPTGVPMPYSSGSGGAEPIGASPGRGAMRQSSASSASPSSQRRGVAAGAAAAAAGAAAVGAAGAAAGEERDWVDDLIDLFVDKCSMCMTDDAGE